MERLTEYHGRKAVIKDKNELGQAMQKLAGYEDIEEQKEKAEIQGADSIADIQIKNIFGIIIKSIILIGW